MANTIDKMNDLLEVQRNDPMSDTDEYMRGMYNGMELMVAMAEGRDPVYKEAPEASVGYKSEQGKQPEGRDSK